MLMLSRRALALALPLAALVLAVPASAADLKITVAYQTAVEPSKVPQAAGDYERATHAKIDWRKFDSGADVITAIASGDVQIGYVGSSPLAAAASRELPIETFFIVGLIGDAEALVVRNGAGISKPADLVGKKIAVPFVSTTHYSLLAALGHWGIPAAQVQILNLKAPEIVAAWQRGDIDGAYVWDPALGKIKETGTVLTSSTEVGKWGAPTFDVWIVRKDFAQKHPEAVTAFAKVTGAAYAEYLKNPAAWSAASPQAAAIARLSGAKVEEVPELLRSYSLAALPEQAGKDLLGGGIAKAVTDTAAFLKAQGRIPAVLKDYAPYVTARFVAAAQN